MLQGIQFNNKDGSKDWYDPIDISRDFSETETHYILTMSTKYEINKSLVDCYFTYDLCIQCGFEVSTNPNRCPTCKTAVNEP